MTPITHQTAQAAQSAVTRPETLPDHLQALVPVGMLTSGGLIAEAIAAVAARVRQEPGWEAFHYARLDDQQFEVTGGIVELQGGGKKWPGEHSSVCVTEADILAELHRNPITAISAMPTDQAAVKQPSISAGETVIAPLLADEHHQNTAGFIQLTLALPTDEQQRRKILQQWHLEAEVMGAKVLACRLLKRYEDLA